MRAACFHRSTPYSRELCKNMAQDAHRVKELVAQLAKKLAMNQDTILQQGP
jgi:hypothetical protein